MQRLGAEDFAMGRCQSQREEDELVISCERYEASSYKGTPLKLSRREQRLSREPDVGRELPPYLDL